MENDPEKEHIDVHKDGRSPGWSDKLVPVVILVIVLMIIYKYFTE